MEAAKKPARPPKAPPGPAPGGPAPKTPAPEELGKRRPWPKGVVKKGA